MGDFVEISNVDLEGSRQFLRRFVVSQLKFRSTARTVKSEKLCCLSIKLLWNRTSISIYTVVSEYMMSESILGEDFIIMTVQKEVHRVSCGLSAVSNSSTDDASTTNTITEQV